MKNKLSIFIKTAGLLAAALFAQRGTAQSFGSSVATFEAPAAQYFFNQYMANPAMAGIDSGLHIQASYRRPWDDLPGAPVTQVFTADGYWGKRVGAGVHVLNDEAGLLQRTKIALTYAYHLPLNTSNTRHLHFGLSMALQVQRLNTKDVIGDPDDPAFGAFNRRDNFFESDFGMAYTDEHFTIQAAMPNLFGHFRDEYKNLAGTTSYFGAASYRILLNGALNAIEPKVSYRGIKEADDILDAGAQFSFLQSRLNVFGMYHTSGNFTVGAGYQYNRVVALQGAYISQASGLRRIIGNSFELSLQLNFLRGAVRNQ
ncbi:PorP/SprF family type IX secretion system membrane protein [Chitinophaga alhagiae]|uniref:PorP/SprF family type IX secretion system membrane protein n=1 Tax=Chitinophaga alhagiae TaxID=2203219 RepID=UPI001300BD45|nr:PorP/SprF family type IX secretion system membrane protein [Chitinophaga alhagiae]